jgi:osmotically-inducible protein OsmY
MDRNATLWGRPVVAFALALAAGAAGADDAVTRQRIESRLTKAHLDELGDVRVDVQDGAAVLSGAVTTVDARKRAEKAARKETKVVENRLRVVPEQRSDSDIRKAVSQTILRYSRYGVFDSVELGVDNGVVLLQGSVLQPYRKNDIESRVARVAGVREIRNEIRVAPVSLFDDQLRRELYRAIYGGGRFVQYSIGPNPPVRIIVENGRITLTGYVNSRVDQQLLGHIARQTLAFGVENKIKVDGEEAQEPAKGSTTT